MHNCTCMSIDSVSTFASFTKMNRAYFLYLYGRFVKKVFYFASLSLMLYSTIVFLKTNKHATKIINTTSMSKIATIDDESVENQKPGLNHMKYILLWTSSTESPFVYLGSKSKVFREKKCQWTNCYVTGDRGYLGHYSEFAAILFNGPRLNELLNLYDIPTTRSLSQKFIFANVESSANYPVSWHWNGFFNWTWTYRLDSDARWGYMAIRNASGHVIGPNTHMHWLSPSEMSPVPEQLKQKLKSKSKAAAWFTSNCITASHRERLVLEIEREMKHYGLTLDIYGDCGDLHCSIDTMEQCLQTLETNYYFYFAFENSFSEDYVTEKILMALKHNTVPVVYGGANYSRFMPEGIYLDALKLSPKEIAKEMNKMIKNPNLYNSFFRWKKHYSYYLRHESPETDDYCRFCAMLNDDKAMDTPTEYKNIQTWWNTNITTPDVYAHANSLDLHSIFH